MDKHELEAKIKDIVEGQLGFKRGQLQSTESFVEDLGADSLDQVELVMAMEEAFNIEISDQEADKVKTVQDLVDLLHTKVE